MQVRAELWVDGDFADLVAFAEDSQGAFAGGELDVVQVQADGFDDPDAGVERQLREDSIAGRRVGLDGAEPLDGGALGRTDVLGPAPPGALVRRRRPSWR